MLERVLARQSSKPVAAPSGLDGVSPPAAVAEAPAVRPTMMRPPSFGLKKMERTVRGANDAVFEKLPSDNGGCILGTPPPKPHGNAAEVEERIGASPAAPAPAASSNAASKPASTQLVADSAPSGPVARKPRGARSMLLGGPTLEDSSSVPSVPPVVPAAPVAVDTHPTASSTCAVAEQAVTAPTTAPATMPGTAPATMPAAVHSDNNLAPAPVGFKFRVPKNGRRAAAEAAPVDLASAAPTVRAAPVQSVPGLLGGGDGDILQKAPCAEAFVVHSVKAGGNLDVDASLEEIKL